MISLTVDHSRFDAALDGIRDAAQKDAPTVLVQEHARLTKLAVDFTPPPKHLGNPQAIGEGAVKADLYSLISEAEPHTLQPIMDKYGTQQVSTFLTTKSGEKIDVEWENIAIGSDRLVELHNEYRNSNGRISRQKAVEGAWKSRIVVAKGLRDEYVAFVQSHVGRMKAKLAYCASILGARFDGFISRHFSSVSGEAVADIRLSDQNPSITFGGRGRGFDQVRDPLRDAGNIRAKQMGKRLKYLAKGYAKDVEQGIRPQPHAQESSGELEEAA